MIYETVKLERGFRADLVVEGRVVVETKCKDSLHPVEVVSPNSLAFDLT